MVTWDNYEEYMMQYVDGELQPAEVQQLMAFLDQNPQLKEELPLFEAAILVPDTTQVFAAKATLLKEEPMRIIAFPMWQRYSIAAGVAAILFISFFTLWNKGGGEQITEVAKVQTPKPAAVAPVASVAPVQPGAETSTPIQEEQSAQHEVKALAASEKKMKNITKERRVEQVVAVNTPKEYMEKIEGSPVTAFATETRQLPIVAIATPPVSLPAMDKAGESKSFLDKLPMEDIKKEGVNDMINAVAVTYKKMNNIKHTITDEKSITVRVEKKQLILSF
jgi:hypothetical protein